MKKTGAEAKRYYIIFRYYDVSSYAAQYSVVYANNLQEAEKVALKIYDHCKVYDVVTKYTFEKRGYSRVYGFTLKDNIKRDKLGNWIKTEAGAK